MTTRRKLTLDDLWRFEELGAIALSPDGSRVAFVMLRKDKDADERRSAIMLLHLDEQGRAVGEPRQLTSGLKSDTTPVWAPDSRRLLFISNRDGEKHQLWLIHTDGGEARRLTSMQRGVSEAAWSPDGQWIAFTAPVSLHDDEDVLTGRTTLDEKAKKRTEERERSRARTITQIWYRLDGRGLFDPFRQLFVMPAPSEREQPDPASIRRLTSGAFDHIQPLWTPDSREIGVLCNRREDRDRSMVSDLWAVERESGAERCLTDGSLEITAYAWSPDGQQALLAAGEDARRAGESLASLYLVPRGGGEARNLTAQLDRDTAPHAGMPFGAPGPYRPQWSEDGRRVYFLLTDHGRVHAHVLDLEQQSVTALTSGELQTHFIALLPGERGLLLAIAEPLRLWEFYLLPLEGDGERALQQLTHLYEALLSEFALSEPQRLEYEGSDGAKIDGWLMKPVGGREGVRYPLLLTIHGGPQSAFGVGFNLNHQYYAAQGFAVFYCNPHGSSSYGVEFMRSVEGDWGGRDYQDIMRGVDECIARGVADPERLGVTGYSYGGYMSMFIIGHTERFKAAVPMAGVSNLASFVGTSDIGFWQALQAKGFPWDEERAAYYRERSPLTAAAHVTTPTRFIHPENDLRCPIEQTEQFYIALKFLGRAPVELVRVPGSWHVGTSKPGQYFTIREELLLEWLCRYIELRPQEYEDA